MFLEQDIKQNVRFGHFGLISSKTANISSLRRLYWSILISGLHFRMLHDILREIEKIWTFTPFLVGPNPHFG